MFFSTQLSVATLIAGALFLPSIGSATFFKETRVKLAIGAEYMRLQTDITNSTVIKDGDSSFECSINLGRNRVSALTEDVLVGLEGQLTENGQKTVYTFELFNLSSFDRYIKALEENRSPTPIADNLVVSCSRDNSDSPNVFQRAWSGLSTIPEIQIFERFENLMLNKGMTSRLSSSENRQIRRLIKEVIQKSKIVKAN